jgi:hypothetical protein
MSNSNINYLNVYGKKILEKYQLFDKILKSFHSEYKLIEHKNECSHQIKSTKK